MIKNVLSEIGGIGLYGVISICLFFVVFTGMTIWAWRMKKSTAECLSELPLDDGETRGAKQGGLHE
jgi:hypothetical protein